MALYFLPEDRSTPERLIDAVAYGEASAPVRFSDGNHDVGLDLDLDGIIDMTYDLPPLSDGTLANLYAVLDDRGDLDLILQLNDGFTWDLDGEGGIGVQAQVRGIHLVSGAGPLSIFTAGATITSDLAFMEQSGYVGVPTGTFDVAVGTSAADPLFTLRDESFDANANYTIVLFGYGGAPLGRAIRDDVSGIPNDKVRLRIIHTAQDVGELDFWDFNSGGDPIELVEDLDFGEESETVEVAPGIYRIAVDVNNDSVFDAFFDTPALPAGQLVNLYALMENGSPRLVTQMQSEIMSSPMTMP